MLTLEPRIHVVELRFVRDVRAFGGGGESRIRGLLEVNQVARELSVDSESLLTAEIVGGKLASPLASVNLRNSMETSAEVVSIHTVDVSKALNR